MSYKRGKDVAFESNIDQSKTLQSANNFQKIQSYGLCPKKNYIIPPTKQEEEQYTFLSGTVRPPFRRQFNLDAVT
jgi:hypothetical protein